MKLVVFLAITCLALCLSVANGLRIKIRLEKKSIERYEHHIHKRQSGESACSDAVEVDRSNLTLPGRLNELDQRVRFYRSKIASNNFDIFQNTTQVPLANSPTTYLREVLNVLRQNGCLPFFFGGAVRDQFLRKVPNDADVEIDCSIETFLNICVSTWGAINCGRSSTRPVGHVGLQNTGLENVDVASTEITFYALIYQLEYTVNSMAYDLNGNDVIIDLTATGESDVCNTPPSIRIPSNDDLLISWELWVGPQGTNGSSLLRFWKLRSIGFTAWNNSTLTFVVNQAMRHLSQNPLSFGSFYCHNVYPMSTFNSTSRNCQTSEDVCEENASKAAAYDAALAQDFGSYWTDVIKPTLLPTCGSSGAIKTGYSISLMCVLLAFVFLVSRYLREL